MKWLQLKLQMLPIVAVEINNTITEYKLMVHQIEDAYNGDRQAFEGSIMAQAQAPSELQSPDENERQQLLV